MYMEIFTKTIKVLYEINNTVKKSISNKNIFLTILTLCKVHIFIL